MESQSFDQYLEEHAPELLTKFCGEMRSYSAGTLGIKILELFEISGKRLKTIYEVPQDRMSLVLKFVESQIEAEDFRQYCYGKYQSGK